MSLSNLLSIAEMELFGKLQNLVKFFFFQSTLRIQSHYFRLMAFIGGTFAQMPRFHKIFSNRMLLDVSNSAEKNVKFFLVSICMIYHEMIGS